MWAALAPYRTAGKLDKTKPKDTFGLIRAPKPHSCNCPGKFLRMLYRLVGVTIRKNSLYRCSTCKEIYILKRYNNYTFMDWEGASEDTWRELGGDAAHKE